MAKPMTLLELHDAIAKAIADAIGHGMREKCERHADAVMTVVGPQLLAAAEPTKRETVKMAPVQGYVAGIPWSLHLEAYDAYCKRYGGQSALIDLEGRNCRGGFGTRELDEFIPGWRERVSEIGRLRAEVARLAAQPRAVPAEITTQDEGTTGGWPALEADLAQECERAMRQRDAYLKTGVSTVGGGSHDLYFGHILRRHGVSLVATQRAAPDIKAMVDRFLGWHLPGDFAPDAGITFTPSTFTHGWPIGTNLFTAAQAEQMFRYVLDLPAEAEAGAVPAERVVDGWVPVPVEPTDAMCDAGDLPDTATAYDIYKAMLAAAPSPGES